MGEEDYEQLRSAIIEELLGLVNPETGKRFVKWCLRREDVYSGEYCYKYPDLLLELVDDYGAGWGVSVPLSGACGSRSLQPGSHKAHSAVFLASNLGSYKVIRRDALLMDVAPTVLTLLGVETIRKFDGQSLITPLQTKDKVLEWIGQTN